MFGHKRTTSSPVRGSEGVLAVLDACAGDFTFPMLDNGYVYPAAARLSVHSNGADWAIVVETFGFSPRAGVPDLAVATFTNKVPHPKTRADYVDESAYLNYLKQHENDAVEYFWPLDVGDTSDDENAALGATVRVRDHVVAVPSTEDCLAVGITTERTDRLAVFELSRYVAETRRDDVLAVGRERTKQVLPGLAQILLLDEWHHPDLVSGELPSATQTFRQIAQVAATGDPTWYDPAEVPNTHWSNWPEGGSL